MTLHPHEGILDQGFIEDGEPSCSVCRNHRFQMDRRDPLHPRRVPCPACQVAQERRRDRLRHLFSLNPQLLDQCTFDTFVVEQQDLRPVTWRGRTFDPDVQLDYLYDVIAAAKAYAAQPRGWFFVAGPPGAGKTHLTVAMCNVLLARGIDTVYATVPDLLDHIKASWDEDVPQDLLALAKTVPMLLLDDLGLEHPLGINEEKLSTIINERATRLLPMIITSNGLIGDLQERYPRVTSRILEQVKDEVLILPIDDYRERQYLRRVRARTTS
jgi:DNA replication protein DnaC